MAKVDEIVANIDREVKDLFKNAPVSARNADRHRWAAWKLRTAADAIERRVKRKLDGRALRMKQEVKN